MVPCAFDILYLLHWIYELHTNHVCLMQKYSVDLHPKQEDAQIPLSTLDVEVFDTTSVKGTRYS